jgi:hypothetical protein
MPPRAQTLPIGARVAAGDKFNIGRALPIGARAPVGEPERGLPIGARPPVGGKPVRGISGDGPERGLPIGASPPVGGKPVRGISGDGPVREPVSDEPIRRTPRVHRKHGMNLAAINRREQQYKRNLRHRLRDCTAFDFVRMWADFRDENESVAAELAERWDISVEVFNSERMYALWQVEEEMRRSELHQSRPSASSHPSPGSPSPSPPGRRWVPPPPQKQPRSASNAPRSRSPSRDQPEPQFAAKPKPQVRGLPSVTEAFQILGLPPDADSKMVRKQFLRECIRMHPDKGGTTEGFLLLKEAYELLT